jgi:cytochrome bd-type quinol oxidase subunit 2
MVILILTILSVLCGLFAIIFHILHIHKNKNKSQKIYKKISIFFRVCSLFFLGLSMLLVNLNIIVDNHSSKTKNLKLINILVFLIPIAIIELLLSFS